MLPALIEHDGVIHFSFMTDEGFHLVCPISVADRKVRQIGTPKSPLHPDGYSLLAWGKLVEDTLRATGQWQAVLTFMAHQVDAAITAGNPVLRKKQEKLASMPRYPL